MGGEIATVPENPFREVLQDVLGAFFVVGD
jgi:hypothetical protein